MRLDLGDVRLMVLTDRSLLPAGRRLVHTVEECVAVGLTHVVLRELALPESSRASLVAALVGVGTTVISARTPLPGAAGVHLPGPRTDQSGLQGSLGPGTADCSITGPDRPVLGHGRSCHSPAEVRGAAAEGAAYAFLSPYAGGGSKPGRTPLPAADFAGHPIPVYALGGVTPANARAALDAGAHGVAVMGAVMGAVDPAAVVGDLIEALG